MFKITTIVYNLVMQHQIKPFNAYFVVWFLVTKMYKIVLEIHPSICIKPEHILLNIHMVWS